MNGARAGGASVLTRDGRPLPLTPLQGGNWSVERDGRTHLYRSADWVTRHGGRVVSVRCFFTMRPNDETDPRPGRVVALEQARELAVSAVFALP